MAFKSSGETGNALRTGEAYEREWLCCWDVGCSSRVGDVLAGAPESSSHSREDIASLRLDMTVRVKQRRRHRGKGAI